MFFLPDIPLCNIESLFWVSGRRSDLSEDITQACSPIRLWIVTRRSVSVPKQGWKTDHRLVYDFIGSGQYLYRQWFLTHASHSSTGVLPLLIWALQNHASLYHLNFNAKSGFYILFPIVSNQSRPKCLNVSPRRTKRSVLLKLSLIHCKAYNTCTHVTCDAQPNRSLGFVYTQRQVPLYPYQPAVKTNTDDGIQIHKYYLQTPAAWVQVQNTVHA
jgi:hypothetical protein